MLERVWRAIFLAICLVFGAAGQLLLAEQDYAVDINFQTIPGDDPILHFTIRTYVAQSTSFYITYNVTGFFAGESYTHAGTGSESSTASRPEAEHIWYYEYQEEDMHPGDTVIYSVKVKAENRWYEGRTHQAIIDQEAPTSLRLRQATYPTTTTTTPPSHTIPPTQPPRTTTPPPAATVRQPAPTTIASVPTTQPDRNFLPASPSLPGGATTRSPQSEIMQDLLDCLIETGYVSYEICSQQSNIGRTPVPTTTGLPETHPKPTTSAHPLPPTDLENVDGSGNEGSASSPPPSQNGGDLSGQQAEGTSPMDITIVIIAIVVPVVVMVGLIIIVTIVVKNRRGRVEPDPYQQVFTNMNYNSTMEIGPRPGLPPPRGPFKKPTEETDYAYADSRLGEGDIYEAITHVDYDLNGKFVKPRPPSVTSSQKSTIIARAPTEWGSDEYEDPASPSRVSVKSRQSNMSTFGPSNSRPVSTVLPNSTYGVYRDPALQARSTLPPSIASNNVYNDTYQDPALRLGNTLPATMAQMPEHIYSDTYQDPEHAAPTSPPRAEDPPQQLYEVPGEQQSPTQQYSALRMDEMGITLY